MPLNAPSRGPSHGHGSAGVRACGFVLLSRRFPLRNPSGLSGASPYQFCIAYSDALKNSIIRFSICTRNDGSSTMWVEPAIGKN
jgi:hypothetical protein